MGLFKNKKKKKKALRKLAARQEAAGRAYQSAVQFRPVGTTNTFGSTNYTYNPQGQLETAGYTLSPELQALSQRGIRDAGGMGMRFADQAISGGLRLGDLSKQYLATSPEQAAQDYIRSQNALLRPGQDQAYADLQLRLANTGRGGLSVAQGGDLMSANPEAAAYYNALAQRDMGLAAQADQYGRERVLFGAGLQGEGLRLGSSAYDPSKAALAYSQGIEGLGAANLGLGLDIGGLRSNAAQVGAEVMLQAQGLADQSRFKADKMGNAFSSFLSSTGKGLVNAGLSAATGGMYNPGGGGGGGMGNFSNLFNTNGNGIGTAGNFTSFGGLQDKFFGPQMGSYNEIYSPANQGFYGSAAQPPSGYSGLSWNRP